MTILNFFEQKPLSQNPAKNLVIFLHGYGSNGSDLIDLAPHFADNFPKAHFISPDAPFDFEGGFYGGKQWFSLQNFDPQIINTQVLEANDILDQFIDEQLTKLQLSRAQLILIGFSQGAMMAMYNSLRHTQKTAAVISYSGRLILPTRLGEKINSKPPICLVHGTIDTVLPFENLAQAQKELENLHIDFEAHPIVNLGHSINPQAISLGKKFLEKLKIN